MPDHDTLQQPSPLKAVDSFTTPDSTSQATGGSVGHEGVDCERCYWGEHWRSKHYENGEVVNISFEWVCGQDGRPKPCQRGLFMLKSPIEGQEE